MPWRERTTMHERQQFIARAQRGEGSFSSLCREFGISRPTGYKWLARAQAEPEAGLEERSRRPRHSPERTLPRVEAAVLALRAERPVWGARKLRHVLQRQGVESLPSASTVHAILKRNGCIAQEASLQHRAFQRFERERPNELWQMDYKGHFALEDGSRCHPLTLLDDHSRFNLCLDACANETGATVRAALEQVFRTYGLPEAMLMDNGSPWGNTPEQRFTPLGVWLLRLDVRVLHGRPRHPQTQGKEERFHRTLQAELLDQEHFADRAACQQGFVRFRRDYNEVRPHEALAMEVPASRYQSSPRPMPQRVRIVHYAAGEVVRRVQQGGRLSFRGRTYRVPKAFRGCDVALRPTQLNGELGVYFGRHRIGTIDLKYLISDPSPPTSGVNHVSEHL